MATKLQTVKALGKYSLGSGVEILQGSPLKTIGYDITTADFTDGAGTSGYFDLPETVPAGSIFVGWTCHAYGAFTGDTTAILTVGTSGTTNIFCDDAGADDLFTAGWFVGAGANEALANAVRNPHMKTATTVRITITGTADFTSIVTAAAGKMKFCFFFLHLEDDAV